jgi:hypothetical protein
VFCIVLNGDFFISRAINRRASYAIKFRRHTRRKSWGTYCPERTGSEKRSLLDRMDNGSDERRAKAARYRAQAARYRFEADALRSGLSKSDKLAFAEQWESLADELDGGKGKTDPRWESLPVNQSLRK